MKCLVCIHGLLSDKKDFSYLANALKPYYDAIELRDMPGHGDNKAPFKTEAIERFYLELLEHLAIKYDVIDLMGYSLGGVVACYLQQRRKIRKLILLAPAYRYLNLKNYPFLVPKEKRTKKETLPLKKQMAYLWRFQSVVRSLSHGFSMIGCETLILWGDEDYLVKESSGMLLYRLVKHPNRRYLILKGINHFNLLFSAHTLFEIQNFLNDGINPSLLGHRKEGGDKDDRKNRWI